MKYDLCIIGGGINGVAIARDAALRGMKVILLEKQDFGSGASSKSSKLAHGGLRYLQQYDFKLVRECLHERNLLLQNAPGLVKPLPFILPVYAGGANPLWKIKLGLFLYDLLAWGSPMPRFSSLTNETIHKKFPALKQEGLQGGCQYYDAMMEDARIVIENMVSAEKAGAEMYNYHPVEKMHFENGRVKGVQTSKGLIEADLVINTTGAWCRELFAQQDINTRYSIAPTKGIHLLLDSVNDTFGLTLAHPKDGRIFFVLPWKGYSLIGTTDTYYNDAADAVSVEKEDEKYLLDAFNHYFPGLKPTVHASFAGLRPLYKFKEDSPSNIPREHIIDQEIPGLFSILGGKYTSYRELAQEVVDLAEKKLGRSFLPCATKKEPLIQVPEKGDSLDERYGTEAAEEIRTIIRNNPEEGKQLCPHHPQVLAEVTYAIQKEKAQTPEDWYFRRTSIGYSACAGKDSFDLVQRKFQISKTLEGREIPPTDFR